MNLNTPLLTTLILALALFALPAQAAKENFDRSKPHLSFFVRSPGLDMSNFEALADLGIEVEAIEYQDGTDPVTRKRPGRVKYSDITLKRGYRGATDIEQWAMQARGGNIERRNISITIVDRSSDAVRTFNLIDCFPVAWKVSSGDKGVLTESLTFAVGRVELQ